MNASGCYSAPLGASDPGGGPRVPQFATGGHRFAWSATDPQQGTLLIWWEIIRGLFNVVANRCHPRVKGAESQTAPRGAPEWQRGSPNQEVLGRLRDRGVIHNTTKSR